MATHFIILAWRIPWAETLGSRQLHRRVQPQLEHALQAGHFGGQPGPVTKGRAGDGELGQLCRRGCGGQEIPDLNKGEWLRGHPEPGNTQPFGKAKPLCLPLSPSGQNQALPTAQQGPWSCLTTCSPLALPHLLTLPAPGPLHLLFSHPRAHFPAGRRQETLSSSILRLMARLSYLWPHTF